MEFGRSLSHRWCSASAWRGVAWAENSVSWVEGDADLKEAN